eukprot:EG_transcript_15411
MQRLPWAVLRGGRRAASGGGPPTSPQWQLRVERGPATAPSPGTATEGTPTPAAKYQLSLLHPALEGASTPEALQQLYAAKLRPGATVLVRHSDGTHRFGQVQALLDEPKAAAATAAERLSVDLGSDGCLEVLRSDVRCGLPATPPLPAEQLLPGPQLRRWAVFLWPAPVASVAILRDGQPCEAVTLADVQGQRLAIRLDDQSVPLAVVGDGVAPRVPDPGSKVVRRLLWLLGLSLLFAIVWPIMMACVWWFLVMQQVRGAAHPAVPAAKAT